MPFALVFIGLLMIVTGANNTYAPFGAQLKSDFTGQKSFVLYAAAIGGVGALGYIPALRRFSHYFLALILISLVLSNKGFFNNLSVALKATPVAPQAASNTSGTTSGPTTGLFGSNQPTATSNTLLNLGPLGTIDQPSIDPGSWLSNVVPKSWLTPSH